MKRDETAAKRARAKRLAKRPDVVAWVDDLSRVMQSAPPGLWLFADSGNLTVMALGEDGLGGAVGAGGGAGDPDPSSVSGSRPGHGGQWSNCWSPAMAWT